jgi:hypothetical protein
MFTAFSGMAVQVFAIIGAQFASLLFVIPAASFSTDSTRLTATER